MARLSCICFKGCVEDGCESVDAVMSDCLARADNDV